MRLQPVEPSPKWEKSTDVHAVQWSTEYDGYRLHASYRNDRGIIECSFSVYSIQPDMSDFKLNSNSCMHGSAATIADAKRKCLEAVSLLKLMGR